MKSVRKQLKVKKTMKSTASKRNSSPSKSVAVSYNTVTSNKANPTQIQILNRDEFVCNVNGSAAFAVQKFPINPGLKGTFPWLAKIANAFEKYAYLSLEFYYIGRGSSADSGDVVLAVDLDPRDPAPTSGQQIEMYQGRVSTGVWTREPVRCVVSRQMIAERQRAVLYVRNAAISDTDIKTYDFGNFFVATNGCSNTNQIGKVYVKYSIVLSIPNSQEDVGSGTWTPPKFITAPTGISGHAETIATGVSQVQDLYKKFGNGTMPEIVNAFGPAGQVVDLIKVAGKIASSTALGRAMRLGPAPSSDADPYVLEFQENFYGTIILWQDAVVYANSASLFKGLPLDSGAWPYVTLPATLATDVVQYEPPWGCTNTAYPTAMKSKGIYPGHWLGSSVGLYNTCQVTACRNMTTAPYVLEGETDTTGYSSILNTCWACPGVLYAHIAVMSMYTIRAKTGDTFHPTLVMNTTNSAFTMGVGSFTANSSTGTPNIQNVGQYSDMAILPMVDAQSNATIELDQESFANAALHQVALANQAHPQCAAILDRLKAVMAYRSKEGLRYC